MPKNQDYTATNRNQHLKLFPQVGLTVQHWQMELESGAGGLIKLTQNFYYKWTYNCGPGTNTRAELLGAWATHLLASRLHIDVLQVVGDSRIVIEWLSNRGDLQVVQISINKEASASLRHNSLSH
jgi:ribonuclease HI